MYKISLISLVLVAASVAPSVRAKGFLIDQDEADIETIAQVICEVKRGTGRQLGHGSTIDRLSSFFHSLPIDHGLAGCGARYALSLDRFAKLLATSNDNVCSEAKLSMIEEFHRDYVSRLTKHVERRESGQLNIPKIVKLFFLHYAAEVSSTCARDALKQMETLELNASHNQMDVSEIDATLGKFQEYMGTSKPIHGYNEVFLPWLLLDGLRLGKYTAYMALGGDKRLNIKIKNSQKFLETQAVCSHLMRPIYGRILLPVVRLISLGYYPESQDLAQQLALESPLKRLYVVAQLCETILPVQVFSDCSLDDEEIIMISAEDAAGMQPDAIPPPLEPIEGSKFGLTPPDNSMESGEFVVDSERAFKTIGQLKANVVARGKVLVRILRLVTRTVTGKMKSKLRRVLVRRANKQEPVNLERPGAEIDETSVYQAEDEDNGPRVRRATVGKLVDFAFFLLLFILIPFFVLQFFVVGGLIAFYWLIRYVTGYAVGDVETALERLWDFPKDRRDLDLTWDPEANVRRVEYVGPRKRTHQPCACRG